MKLSYFQRGICGALLGGVFLASNLPTKQLLTQTDPISSMTSLHPDTAPCIRSAVCSIPHPQKAYKGGEDNSAQKALMVAVADGVGGWASRGVDPAVYSNELCRNLEAVFEERGPALACIELFAEAARRSTSTGSSTLVVGVLDAQANEIDMCLLGDAGYMLVRPEGDSLSLLYRSKDQVFSFDFPFQCGTNGNSPHESAQTRHAVRNGDLVVLGSDGVWDNLYDEMVLDTVRGVVGRNRKGAHADVDALARAVADEAFRYSQMADYVSPYEKGAKASGKPKYEKHRGGKEDDITVLVGEIVL